MVSPPSRKCKIHADLLHANYKHSLRTPCTSPTTLLEYTSLRGAHALHHSSLPLFPWSEGLKGSFREESDAVRLRLHDGNRAAGRDGIRLGFADAPGSSRLGPVCHPARVRELVFNQKATPHYRRCVLSVSDPWVYPFIAGSIIRVCRDQPIIGDCHSVGSDFLSVGKTE